MPTRTTSPGRGTNGASVIFDRYLARLRDDVTRAAARSVAELGPTVATTIRARTLAGVGVDGRRFVKYRPSTVRKRRRAGKQTGRVDLRFTGDMLASLAARPGLVFGSVEVFFADRAAERVARFHMFGTRKMVAREFFGLNRAEALELFTGFKADVKRSIPTDRRRRVVLTILPAY